MTCKRCDFRFECDTIRMKGAGSKKSDIMIVLDMPSKSDDEYGVPLSGDTAKKLKYLMRKAKVPLKKCYVTHALKCYSKAPPKKAHFEACEYWLLKEILLVKPKVIIVMGGKGLKILLGETATKDFRGFFWGIEIGGFKTTVLPTYGPNAALTKWEYDDYIVHDVQKAYSFSKNGILPEPLKVDVTLVTDLKTLKQVEQECIESDSLGFDLETTGLKFNQDEIVMAGFCPKPGRAIVIPYFVYDIKKHGKKWNQENIHAAVEINKFVGAHKKEIRQSLKRIFGSDVRKTAHNGKFDEKFCRYNGFPVKKFTFDTIIAHALVDENKLHNLTFCLEWYGINHFSDDCHAPYEQDLWPYVNKDAKKKKPYSYAPPLLLSSYLGKDVDGCCRLKPILLKKLKEEKVFKLFKKQQMPLSRVMADFEYTGIAMEVVGLQTIAKRFSEKLDKLERNMKNMTGNLKFNPRSSKQVVHYLQKLDAPLFKKTKGGGFSSGESVLEQLARKPRKRWGKFSKYLLQHREITKLKGTYLDGSDGNSGILTHTDGKGVVHANWNIHTPRTGRMSCSDPNLQQIPRPNPKYPWANIRQLFYPRKKNWVMFSFDYKQLEMRIAAYLSRDYVMLKEIADDVDMHTRNAVMFGTVLGYLPDSMSEEKFAKIRGYKPPENWEKRFKKSKRERIELKIHDAAVYDEHRTFSKAVGFGVNYGIMASTLAKDHDREVDEVQEALDVYFRKYKKLAIWREAMQLEWMEKGVLILPETNRKRRFYGASEWFNSKWAQDISKRDWDISNVDRQAMNFPIQGFANEIYTQGKIKFYNAMKKERMKSHIMLSLHDGLLGEGPKAEMKELIPMAKETMERILSEGKKYQVNLQIDCDIYEKWGGKKVEL